MTTPDHSDLAYSLTKHYFGEPLASVIKILFNYDQASLHILKLNLPKVKLHDLKKSLLILVKYQLVDYIKTVKNFSQQFEYSVMPQRVFSFFRISRSIQVIASREGHIANVILSNITEKALLNKEKLSQITSNKLKLSQAEYDNSKMSYQINDLIDKLISGHYIVQTSNNLCLNIERFDRDYRDDLIVETIHNYYNHEIKIKSLCRTILDLTIESTADDAPMTAPIPLSELMSVLIPKDFADKNQLERYLAKLTSESNNRFFSTSGIHPNKGPMYALNVGLVVDYLVKEHLSSVITTRFGPKCCRVFKVLLLRGPLLLKQIEEFIMLPARDVREYSYMLIKEGFIRNRQVPKTPDNAPGKSVFIMSVELDQVVYGATDVCCRSINNLLMRYEFELHRNKSLLDRSKAVQKLLGSDISYATSIDTKATQDDWNQYFNGHELSQLEWINRTLDKILLAKTQVDETLFLLHSWLNIRPNLGQHDTT